MWNKLVDGEILPDARGHLQQPAALKRHAVAQQEGAAKWAALAEDDVRCKFVHPSVYANINRASRLNALGIEAARRGRGQRRC